MRRVIQGPNKRDDVTVCCDKDYLCIWDEEGGIIITKDMLLDFVDAVLAAEDEMAYDV